MRALRYMLAGAVVAALGQILTRINREEETE